MPDQRRCPDCGAALSENTGFITWCPECNWNLSPQPERPAYTRLAAFERRIADGSSRRLVSDMAKVAPTKTKLPVWRGLSASLLALPIHLVTLASFFGGVALLVFGGTVWHRIIGGALVLIALCTAPRPNKPPRHSARLAPDQAPALFGVVREIADAVGSRMPAEILISRDVTASVTRVGWRGRRVMTLGVPLWVAEPPQARVAMIGHELGHFAHGDQLRSLWIDGAMKTAGRWITVTRSRGRDVQASVPFARYDRYSNFLDRIFFGPLEWILVSYVQLIVLVNGPAHRRQEALADLDGLRVGGSDGAVALMNAILAEPSITIAMSRSAINPQANDMWALVRDQVEAVPEIERERRRRAAAYERNRIDDSHPTTSVRLELLRARPFCAPAVELDPATWARIDAELAPAMRNAARHARDALRR